MANSQINDMPGWAEWDAKLSALAKDVPRVGVIRAVKAMQGVIMRGLKDETLFARIDSAKIKGIAVESVGGSFRKGQNDTHAVARVGYGVGRRSGKGMPAPHTQSGTRTAVLRERLSDRHGTRAVYRRYKAGPKVGTGNVMPGQIRGRMWNRQPKRMSDKAFSASQDKLAGKLARRITHGLGGPRGRSLQRIRGSGVTKRNIHWAVFGTRIRTVKSWRGTGNPRKVGRMRAYLMGILDRTLRKYGERAYAAALEQYWQVVQVVFARKTASNIRSLARQYSTRL